MASKKDGPRLGNKVRALRRREGLTQQQLAERLQVSPAYLNLIENNRRPLPAQLLIQLATLFRLDLASFSVDDEQQVQADLMEVFGDPLFDAAELGALDVREFAGNQPALARAVLGLYRAYKAALDDGAASVDGGSLDAPSEEVSELLQKHGNYFPELEDLAEATKRDSRIADDDLTRGLIRCLEERHGITVEVVRATQGQRILRSYDPASRHLVLSELLPPRSRNFQLAHQLGLIVMRPWLDTLTRDAMLTSEASQSLARVALANYFAGCVLMPYQPFLEAAEHLRYDIELLGHRFRTSFEQVCHRLTTLRRPSALGVPFHLLRVDIAGNISKRFSGSGIRFARFSGACPRWNVFSAFLTPGTIQTQVSEFPDGARFFCIATTLKKSSVGYARHVAPQALGMGTTVEHAKRLVYADGIDLSHAVPVGVTCRLCERSDCGERAFPAVKAPLHIDENLRGVSFYARPLRIVS